MLLIDFYNEMNDEQQKLFIKQAYIPNTISLEFEYFEEFYEERKKMLITKLKELLG